MPTPLGGALPPLAPLYYNQEMETFSLQSGSNGNAVYVEANGTRLLFDAGISASLAERRMADQGRDIRDVDALIISHEHDDHVRSAGAYHRMFRLPVYMTRRTLQAARCPLGRLSDVRFFSSGDAISIGKIKVHTARTMHDAIDGVVFVVECAGRRLGILTDLGHPFRGLREILEAVDAAYLESNYDRRMLEEGSYPQRLKDRISGPGGHVSNDEAAWLLSACGRRRPAWVAVAHLSASNNTPRLAIDAQHRAVGQDYPVYHAPRNSSSQLLTV